MEGYRHNTAAANSTSPERKTQSKKCENENKRREDENRLLSEIAELLPSTSFEEIQPSNGYNKPDKSNILSAAVGFLKPKEEEEQQAEPDSNNAVIQQSQVSSTNKPLMPTDVQCPLILEALGFWFVVNGHGRIEYVSKNIAEYINYTAEDLIGQSIYNIIAVGDTFKFTSRLNPSGTCGSEAPKNCTFNCRMRKKTDGSENGNPYEQMQITTVLQSYPTDRDFKSSSGVSCSGESHSCLVCFARQLNATSKKAGAHLATVTTKQDLRGKILACDFTNHDGNCSHPQVIGKNVFDYCHNIDVIHLQNHLTEVIRQGSNLSQAYRTLLFDINHSKYVFVQTKSKLFKNKTTGDGEFVMSTHSLIRPCTKGDLSLSARGSLVWSLIDTPGAAPQGSVLTGEVMAEQSDIFQTQALLTPSSNSDDLMGMIDELSNSYNLNGDQWWPTDTQDDKSSLNLLLDFDPYGLGQFGSFHEGNISNLNGEQHLPLTFTPCTSTSTSISRAQSHKGPYMVVSKPPLNAAGVRAGQVTSTSGETLPLYHPSEHPPSKQTISDESRQRLRQLLKNQPVSNQDTILKKLLNEPEDDDEQSVKNIHSLDKAAKTSGTQPDGKGSPAIKKKAESGSLLINLLNEQDENAPSHSKPAGLLQKLLKQNDDLSFVAKQVEPQESTKRSDEMLTKLLTTPTTIPVTPLLSLINEEKRRNAGFTSNGSSNNSTHSTHSLSTVAGKTSDGLLSTQTLTAGKDMSANRINNRFQRNLSRPQDSRNLQSPLQATALCFNKPLQTDAYIPPKVEVNSPLSINNVPVLTIHPTSPRYAGVSQTILDQLEELRRTDRWVDPLKDHFKRIWDEQLGVHTSGSSNNQLLKQKLSNSRKRKISEVSAESVDSTAGKPSMKNKLLASLLAKPSHHEEMEMFSHNLDGVATAVPQPKATLDDLDPETVSSTFDCVEDLVQNSAKVQQASSSCKLSLGNRDQDSFNMLDIFEPNPSSLHMTNNMFPTTGMDIRSNSNTLPISSTNPLTLNISNPVSFIASGATNLNAVPVLSPVEDLSDPTWDLQGIDFNELDRILGSKSSQSPLPMKSSANEKTYSVDFRQPGGQGVDMVLESQLPDFMMPASSNLSHIYGTSVQEFSKPLPRYSGKEPQSHMAMANSPCTPDMAQQRMPGLGLYPSKASHSHIQGFVQAAPPLHGSGMMPVQRLTCPVSPDSTNPNPVQQPILQQQHVNKPPYHQNVTMRSQIRFSPHIQVQPPSFPQLGSPLPDNFSEIMKTTLAPNVTLQRSPGRRGNLLVNPNKLSPTKTASLPGYSNNLQPWQENLPIMVSSGERGQPQQAMFQGRTPDLGGYGGYHSPASSSQVHGSHRPSLSQGCGMSTVPSPIAHQHAAMPLSPFSDIPMMVSPQSATSKLSPGSASSIPSPAASSFAVHHGGSQTAMSCAQMQTSPGIQRHYSSSSLKSNRGGGSPSAGTSQFVKQQLHGFLNNRAQQQQQAVSGKGCSEQTSPTCSRGAMPSPQMGRTDDSSFYLNREPLQSPTLPLHHSPCGTFLKPAPLPQHKSLGHSGSGATSSSCTPVVGSSLGEDRVDSSDRITPTLQQENVTSAASLGELAIGSRRNSTSLLQQLLSDNS